MEKAGSDKKGREGGRIGMVVAEEVAYRSKNFFPIHFVTQSFVEDILFSKP
jgi:hypothetical protein